MKFCENEKPNRIFVIGYMGSDRRTVAKLLAEKYCYEYIDTDEIISQRDGRSVLRICMTMGEHEYRNKEYELLCELSEKNGVVVSCGDGIVLDDMNIEILKKNSVIFVDSPIGQLWETARSDKGIPYAFMSLGDEAERFEKFLALYEVRKFLYNSCII